MQSSRLIVSITNNEITVDEKCLLKISFITSLTDSYIIPKLIDELIPFTVNRATAPCIRWAADNTR